MRLVRVLLVLVLVASGLGTNVSPAPAGQTAAGQSGRDRTDTRPGQQHTVVGAVSPIHDPALIKDGKRWYVFSTGLVHRENGGTIQISVSTDGGTTWTYQGTVWNTIPAWIDRHFADGALPDNLWAPDIHEHDGTYYLYYSASRFGTDDSVTALATNTTLDPKDPDYRWVDRGPVLTSPATGLDPANPDKTFNAIDANLVTDGDQPYLAIGSFWYGIFLVPLSWPSGKPVADWRSRTVNIADRMMPGNPIEAPYIVRRNGYFYLFVSFDFCCRGADSTYKIAVGRSKSITGPYLDADGKNLYGGGGTVIMSSHGAMIGTGGQSIDGNTIAYHYYDASNQASPYLPTLALQRIGWRRGWPWLDQRVQLPAITRTSVARDRHRVTLTVTGTGVPTPVVRWQRSPDQHTWRDLADQPPTTGSGATARSRLSVRTGRSAAYYRAVLINAHGQATSAVTSVR